jgi:hypothetical protein
MYRLAEEVARKILRNIRSPEIGPIDATQKDPFQPKNLKSVGFIDPYCCIGSEFEYLIELPYPYINPALPAVDVLDGFWLYRKQELFVPMEPFNVPRYLADPNINNSDDQLDVTDCSIIVPSEVEKLTCKSIMTFEKLVEHEPAILSCLAKDLK